MKNLFHIRNVSDKVHYSISYSYGINISSKTPLIQLNIIEVKKLLPEHQVKAINYLNNVKINHLMYSHLQMNDRNKPVANSSCSIMCRPVVS